MKCGCVYVGVLLMWGVREPGTGPEALLCLAQTQSQKFAVPVRASSGEEASLLTKVLLPWWLIIGFRGTGLPSKAQEQS